MQNGRNWNEGEPVEQKILESNREGRETVYLSVCSICNRPVSGIVATKDLRFFDDLGIICKRCFERAKPCIIPGCGRPGIPKEGGLCRVHFMGEDIIFKRSLLGNHAAHIDMYGEKSFFNPIWHSAKRKVGKTHKEITEMFRRQK